MSIKNKFWNNKNVLVTGHEGFLGSHLTKNLNSRGANVIGLDLVLGRKNTVLTNTDRKQIIAIKGDVADYKLVNSIIKKYKIKFVFHLAAEAIVGKCLIHPLAAFSSNICGTWNILEACRNSKQVQSIVIASSDKAYGSHKDLPYNEDLALMGKHPYDVSKSCADLIAHAYSYTYGLPAVVTRCGNIFGPGEYHYSRIIPDAIRCALRGKTLLIRSNGRYTRDYIYVDDIVEGYTLLAENTKKLNLNGEAFNFSNEKPITVLKLVKTIYRSASKKTNYKILNHAKYEIKHQYLSSLKARKILNWKPKYSLEKSLAKTIEWYKDKNDKK
ncbi:MAG: sugar dehydratase [Candidatus Omnitrophica bacterium CG1_02_44_16]|nr:MAG: sugar dehydratase [Candidatus Omnitrophica bacterium CG1_02_44_16]